ncbi:transcriptional regulator, TetR family [Agreia bicolorata]|uniref:Transcriptional regulator, TetR family n=1 Tax=Agreia bicolorata TaxID=110935 RepID=A0A1T4YIM2_9MICO|nr:TetR/AcrR family transcriptional regulator [Agreia bicolorata]SKB01654.1 transcriptional regulator, TetR family [Agreia bicolorata]
MPVNNVTEEIRPDAVQVRNEPIQARSSDRIAALLDAAAAVVAEVGIERLTTALVADRAEASIGTVYRYFPDRIAVLTALGTRSVERFLRQFEADIVEKKPESWIDAVVVSIGSSVAMHRGEVGFTSIRLGDLVSSPETDVSRIRTYRIAQNLHDVLIENYGLPQDPAFLTRLEVAVTMIDALLVRAFMLGGAGDETIIDECEQVVRNYLARQNESDALPA